MKYNIITGISIGSVNAGLLSQFPIGEEQAMASYLVDLWQSINGTSDIYVEWGGGLIDGLLFQRGLYNNAPVIELGKKWITAAPRRNITIGSTNLDLGIFQNFDESLGMAIIDGIIASGSIPFFFPPHDFLGYAWADGGCIINLDVFSAVTRCLEVVNEEKNITVDMIYCDPYSELPNDTSFKTLEVLQRVYAIHSHDKGVWYTFNTKQAYPEVNYRYVLQPSENIAPLLNFSKASIEFDIALGIKDGNTAVGSGARSGASVIEELYMEMRNKIIFP